MMPAGSLPRLGISAAGSRVVYPERSRRAGARKAPQVKPANPKTGPMVLSCSGCAACCAERLSLSVQRRRSVEGSDLATRPGRAKPFRTAGRQSRKQKCRDQESGFGGQGKPTFESRSDSKEGSAADAAGPFCFSDVEREIEPRIALQFEWSTTGSENEKGED